MVSFKRKPFPLRERVDHLGLRAYGRNVKRNGSLVTVEVIVKAGALGHEQGSGYALEIKRRGKFLLEGGFDVCDGALRVVRVQNRRV